MSGFVWFVKFPKQQLPDLKCHDCGCEPAVRRSVIRMIDGKDRRITLCPQCYDRVMDARYRRMEAQ